ncbi:hypothetical protein HGI15_13375 [Modestobacter lapidis]|nr:hypothetical protein [Modestobacter lapidis]
MGGSAATAEVLDARHRSTAIGPLLLPLLTTPVAFAVAAPGRPAGATTLAAP